MENNIEQSTQTIEEVNSKKKRVSYSQFSNYLNCSYRWKLDFIDGKRIFEDSINTCFGTVIHEILQDFIKTWYTENIEKAESIDLKHNLKEKLVKELTDKNVKYTDDQLMEFVIDGENILDEFSKVTNKIKHFPRQKYEFIGVEVPLLMDIKNNIEFTGYVDLILREKESGKIKIYDFKTSSNGWNSYMKENCSKYYQLLLYKTFCSKIFNIPVEKIEVEFFILKRKLYENASFPQSRLQIFRPNSSKSSLLEAINDFTKFVDSCFLENGEFNLNTKFEKNPGKANKNCRFCPHYKTNCFPNKKD